MKKLLILLAFVPFVLQAQLIQNPYIQKGITAHFPLSEWSSQPGVALTSGSLVSGAVYKIGNYVAGDSFTSSGASANASGVVFVYNGSAPTWTNGSLLRRLNSFQSEAVTGSQFTTNNTVLVPGQYGEGADRYYSFDGTADHVSFADADAYDFGTGDFALAVTYTPTNVTQSGKYLINKEASGVGYGLYQTEDDVYIRLDDGTTDVSAKIGTAVLTAGTKVNLFCTFDRDGNATLYVNGASAGTVAISTASLTISNAGALRIGDATAGSAVVTGKIYRHQLFNRVLSAAEVLAYYNDPTLTFADKGATNTGLVTGDDSDFDTDTGFWTKDAGVTIPGDGLCHYTGVGTGFTIRKASLLTIGKIYRVSFTVKNYSAGGYGQLLEAHREQRGRPTEHTHKI